jgi:hemolysin-activating ACP:hemolysin acyltransferase
MARKLRCGTNVRIVELIAPFGGEAIMREQICGSVNSGNA